MFVSGGSVLHAPLALEALGGREDSRSHDGPRHRHLLRGGEEAEEEAPAGLSLGEPEVPQLVVLSLLPLRVAQLRQRRR